MEDEDKTKEQLINELMELRQRITKLEALETERKQAEEALRGLEKEWRKSFNSLEDIMILIDKDLNIERINDNGLKLIGKPKEEIVGQKCYKILHGRDNPIENCPLEKSSETKKVESVDRFEKDFGRYFSIKCSPIFDETGEIMRFVDLMRDITERKKAEEKLRLFSHSIESLVDGIAMGNLEGRITYVNEAFIGMFGYSREELTGKEIAFIYSGDQILKLEEAIKATMEGSWRGELIGKRKDGELFPMAISSSGVVDDKGKIIAIMASHKDITERKRAEEDIKRQRDMLNTILSSVDCGINIVSQDYRVQFQNKLLIDRFGDFRGKVCYREYMDRDEPCPDCPMQKAIRNNRVESTELVAADGRNYDVVATPLKNPDGTMSVVEIATDITEKKKAEQELLDSKNYNRGLIESSIDAIVTFDKDGIILDVNEETIKLTGYSREELIGTPFKNYFTDPEKAQEVVDLSFKEGIVRDYELIIRSKTGNETIVSYNATVYRNSRGELEGVFAAARDITKIKKNGEIFSALYELSSKIDITTEELLDFTADEVAKVLNPDMCYITTLKDDNLFFRALRGDAECWIEKGRGVKVDKTVCGLVIGEKKPIVIPDIKKDPISGRYPYLKEYGIESYVGIPLLSRERKAIGTICVLNKEPRDYSEEDLELLSIFANRVSLAIEKGRVENELVNAKAKLQERAAELQELMADLGESNIRLRESEEKYKAIFESANDVIVTLDLRGNITAVNRKVEEIAGYRREELIGKNIARLKMFPPKSLAIILKNFAKRMIKVDAPPYEVELMRKHGERRFIEINATPLKKRGKIVGDLVMLRDITERREAEEKLREKMDELERFNKLMVGRELRMIELKERINELEEKLKTR